MEETKGNLNISKEVVAAIASKAASEVEGVAGMSGGVVNGIAKLLTGSQLTKGVKVDLKDNTVKVDIFIIIEYGFSIPEVAWKVQTNAKEKIEQLSGLSVERVNVYVQGIHLESTKK